MPNKTAHKQKEVSHDKKLLIVFRVLSVLSFGFFVYMCSRFITQSLWRDEAVTLFTTRLPPREIIQVMIRDNNPPLFRLLLAGLSKVFGEFEATARLVSLLCYIGSALLLRKQINHPIRKELATIFFFTMPHSYYFGTEGRAYTFFMLLALASLWATKQILNNRSAKNLAIFIIVNTLMLYSFTTSIIAFATNLTVLFYLLCAKHNLKLTNIRELFQKERKLILFCLLPVALFAPWLVVMAQQFLTFAGGNREWWLHFDPVLTPFQMIFSLFSFAGLNYNPTGIDIFINWQNAPWIILFVLGLALALGATVRGARCAHNHRGKAGKLAVATPLLLTYLVSFIFPVNHIRYYMYAIPATLVVAAKGIPTKKTWCFVAVAATLALNLSVAFGLYRYGNKTDYKYLLTNEAVAKSEALIISDNSNTYYPCRHYAGECKLLMEKDQFDPNVGTALLDENDFISEEYASQFEKIIIISWDQPVEYNFLKDYEKVQTIEAPPSTTSVSIYTR